MKASNSSSRRQILCMLAMAGARSSAACKAAFNGGNVTAGAPKFSLVKEMDGTLYGAVSPDTTMLCVYRPNKPVGRATLRRVLGQKTFSWDDGEAFTLSVLEVDDWKEIYSRHFRGGIGDFSFAGNKFLFGSYLTYGPVTTHYLFVDLISGQTSERSETFNKDRLTDLYALREHQLIGSRGRELVRVHWPAMQRLAGMELMSFPYLLSFPASRDRLVHLEQQQFVCGGRIISSCCGDAGSILK